MLILAQNYVQNGTKISKKVTGKKMDPQIGFETVKQTGHCQMTLLRKALLKPQPPKAEVGRTTPKPHRRNHPGSTS